MKINKRKFCECGCGQRVNNRFVYQHHTRGKNHPNYTHGNKYAMKQWKQAIYKKDNYTCQKCGKQKLQGHHRHAHHIKSKEQYPELIYSIDNGMTVCIDCHNRLHHLGKIMPPCTEERKRKIKLANSGKVKTPEHCNKISLSLKGNIPWNKGVVGKQIAWNKGLNKESMKKYIKFKKEATMSHIQTIEVNITDLQALKNACKRLNLEWKQDQKTFKWYQPVPEPCDHAISVPGANYEIGVLKNGDRKGYTLQVDYYDRKVTEKIGQLGGFFKQAYALELAKLEAIKKGYSVREHKINERQIELRITVGG